MITLDEFTLQQKASLLQATGELSGLLRDIGLAGKRINAGLSKSGLTNMSGAAGFKNVHQEEVKKQDVFANDVLTEVLSKGGNCAGVASEERDDFLAFDELKNKAAKYVVMFDPLDGSGNVDNNISVGTIFGVYHRATAVGTLCNQSDFLQAGIRQVAAGYIIYGPSTILVYATERGVNGFTLDPAIGEFCLSHKDIKCPEAGNTYSLNHSLFFQYSSQIRRYINDMQRWNGLNPGAFNQRYVGSMVADLHRTLLSGGIFLYPGTPDTPDGKLRLMYECNPFAFIFEMAGAAAIGGRERVLSIKPAKLHQRIPFYAGSKQMVEELKKYINNNTLRHSYAE
ncbi:MAG: class 1 fructose-bisphosphatase [Chitinophagaceae bacterium]